VQCPYCGGDSRVLDSRGSADSVRRRRECQECERRFTTYEVFRLELRVTKRDGTNEPFERDKLLGALRRVTWDRTVSDKAREDLVRGMEAELADSGAQVIASATLAERLHARLRELDAIAAARFGANYQLDDGTVRFVREEDTSQLALPMVAPPAGAEEQPPERKSRKKK
jgi:transcriptional repressor NrdR